jgi:hypothetical protein
MIDRLNTNYPVYSEYIGMKLGENYIGTDFRHTDRPKFGLEFRIMDLVPIEAIF